MKLLLDTHVFLWAITKDPRLTTEKAAAFIEEGNELFLSIASVWEMLIKVGIGKLPAIIALFFYALLPILRNTITGLQGVDASYKKVAAAMGLSTWQRLRIIEIPLAKPTILAGIRTAAVINVGTATLAAFIGAGGLGDYIVTGLALNNTEMILRGAIPSAFLAIGMELLFELIERVMVLKHMRQQNTGTR